jgi:hypothetical protein
MGIFEFISVILLCVSVVLVTYLKFRKPPEPPCRHEWEIHQVVMVNGDFEKFHRYHLRCKKCGEMKNKDMH